MMIATTPINYQQINITVPHAHDVLCGRGAGITKHEGNKRWRELIRINRERYTALPRNQRPIVAESIVKTVRSLTPPGRFLSKDAATQLWYDIGDDRAVEKTAQAMRDSKKNNKDKANSRGSSPESSPSLKLSMAVVPESAVQCSPEIARPAMSRLQTDDTFAQRIEGFSFEAPILERSPSAMFFVDTVGEDSTAAKCSPRISKPLMARKSTFDQRLEEMNFEVPRPLITRSDSGFSLDSLGMLEDDELEILEASCEMPSQQPLSFYSEIHCHMRIDDDGDVRMDETQPTTTFPNLRSHPSHWSI